MAAQVGRRPEDKGPPPCVATDVVLAKWSVAVLEPDQVRLMRQKVAEAVQAATTEVIVGR